MLHVKNWNWSETHPQIMRGTAMQPIKVLLEPACKIESQPPQNIRTEQSSLPRSLVDSDPTTSPFLYPSVDSGYPEGFN